MPAGSVRAAAGLYSATVLRPELTFFVELESDALVELFDTPGVIDFLKRGRHALSMGLLDRDDARAELVRELRRHGVPVTAWLLLDEADGYWMNADNAETAWQCYEQFHAWAGDEKLHVHRVGLDIEPPRRDLERFIAAPLVSLLERLSNRRDLEHLRAAEADYAKLVARIHRDGRSVEAYQLNGLLDERAAKSTLLRRAFGFVEVQVDHEVMMLYASYLGPAMARLYFPGCSHIAVGSTGGGIHADDDVVEPKLTWEQLETELRAAARHSNHLYVFSLEGCVWNNMLAGLDRMDFTGLPEAPRSSQSLEGLRARRFVNWILTNEEVIDRVLPPPSRREPGWWKRVLGELSSRGVDDVPSESARPG